eukprot:7055386-Pyramimonas_sp.AAC.1
MGCMKKATKQAVLHELYARERECVLRSSAQGLVAESVNYVGSAVHLGDAAVDTWRAALGTDVLIDTGLVLALLAQVRCRTNSLLATNRPPVHKKA